MILYPKPCSIYLRGTIGFTALFWAWGHGSSGRQTGRLQPGGVPYPIYAV